MSSFPTLPPFLQEDLNTQLVAPLLIPPPGGFPVTETAAPGFATSANVIFQEAIKPDEGIMDWLKKNQTLIFIIAGALFAFAVLKGGRRRR